MRTLFTFAVLSAVTFSGVALGQIEISTSDEIAVEAVEPNSELPVSIVDLGPAPSDAEIDTARTESGSTVVEGGIIAVTPEYTQPLNQGVTYPEYTATQDCGCQSGTIAPVVYQQPVIEGIVEGAGEVSLEGSVEPVADATSVVESTEAAPVYTDSSVVTEAAPMQVESAPVVISDGTPMPVESAPVVISEGTPMPIEGESVVVQGDPVVSGTPSYGYQSAPAVTCPAATAPCCTPQRRGFFRTLFGR